MLLAIALPAMLRAQDSYSDPNEAPLGDVARNLRKKAQPAQGVIDDDNFSQVMKDAEGRHSPGAMLRYLMSGEMKGFQVAVPDATCSLSFTANAKSLLSSQYAQMQLPESDMERLIGGTAAIEDGTLTVSVFNATDWHVSELAVALTVVRKNEPGGNAGPDSGNSEHDETPTSRNSGEKWGIPDSSAPNGHREKKQDTTIVYRMRAAAVPFDKAVFEAPLNLELAAGDEWHWAMVEAKGYPPQSYVASAPVNPIPATTPVIPSSLLVPQDSVITSLSQAPQ